MIDQVNPLRSARSRAISFVRAVSVMAVFAASPAVWATPSITFAATDLADVTAGQDLWSYDYLISGAVGEFESVNLLFQSANYSADLTVSAFDPQLSPVVTPPVLVPASDGQVMVTALNALPPSSTVSLSVQFVWTGTGQPGSQAFEYLDDQFNVLATGVTAAVPEVSSAALLFAGLIMLLPLARVRRRG